MGQDKTPRGSRLARLATRRRTQTALGLVMAISVAGSGAGGSLALAPSARAQVAADVLPTGGVVVHGQADIHQSGAQMRIDQHSATLIANWDSFSIGSDASVTFAQPDAASLAVNRVVNGRASEILGRLSANGQVMLINPAGILVGKSGRVEVGSLTATTLNLADSDIADGDGIYAFRGSGSGAVRNLGQITVPEGGLVALLAPVVENAGRIATPGGAALLAGAAEVDLQLGGSAGGAGLLGLRINRGALAAAVTNGGVVSAANGLVVMTAKGLDQLSRAVVNNEGIVEAQGLSRSGGRIVLGGGATSAVVNSGQLDVSSASGTGGAIVMEGEEIALGSTARLDASGAKGGGTILVGGSWQNSDPSVYQARKVTAAAGAVLDASALASGHGGTIVLWSDIHDKAGLTDVSATLLARGGASGGHGGRIETSGHLLKVDRVKVDTTAARGQTGEWLLDPYNITIGASGDTVSGSSYMAGAPGSLIDVATLVAALGTSKVTVSTGLAGSPGAEAGTITVNSAIGATTNALELKAASSILLNADITRSGATGGLTLRAGTGSIGGTGTLVLGGGTKLSLAHGSTLANAINLTAGGATIDFAPLEVEYLVVGGGSGARSGSAYPAGGGGGAVLSGTTLLTNSNSYAITVGAGGAYGLAGTASSGFGITANPGTIPAGTGVGGTSGSGFTGGINIYDGSGGGGAGGAGGNGTANTAPTRKAGYGGIGINSSISGAVIGYGGGGAGGYASTWTAADTAASGATYGGGAPGQSGTANRGGGGSGGAGAGGSGVVVARYVGPDATSGGVETAFTGNGTIGVNGVNYQVRTFNSSGTLTVDNLAASLTGSISGSGNLAFNASNGTITIAGASTYTGATTIAGGRLATNNLAALGSNSAVSLANVAGTELSVLSALSVGSLSGGGATGGNVALGTGVTLTTGLANTNTTFAGSITGAGTFTQAGTGKTTLTGSLINAQTFAVEQGTLATGGSAALGVDDGSGRDTYGGTLRLVGTGKFVHGSSATQILTGTLQSTSSAGELQQTGSGTLRLMADASGFSGIVRSTAGTLGLTRSDVLGSGSLVLGGGTTLRLSHGTTIANAINLTGNVTVDFAPLEVEYLIVGGGGGGGYARGGGGGGGGFVEGSAALTNGATYAVIVGEGGVYLANGASSSISGTGLSVTALGGGAGNASGDQNAASGGGASAYSGATAGLGTAGQGNDGGLGTGDNLAAGGGGGAGAAGGNGSGSTGGAGGAGQSRTITGATRWYAGGGGGFSAQTGGAAVLLGGAGGLGGGGKGGDLDSAGASGMANTGGGAGGTYTATTAALGGGTGGSGIVVARYIGPDATTGGAESSFTGNGTIGVGGVTYQVRTFTDSGTLSVDKLSAALTGTISGSGDVTVNAAGGTLTLSGANSYGGTTTVIGGQVTATGATALGSSAVVLANTAGAKLQFANAAADPVANPLAVTIASLAGGGATGGEVIVGPNVTLQTGGSNASTSFAGAISGSGIFEKTGTGTLTLTGSFLGSQLAVTGGTLLVDGAGGLGSDDGFGRDLYSGSITLGSAGTLSFSATAAQILTGTISGSGSLRLSSGTLKLANANTGFSGTTTVTGGTLGLYDNAALGSGALAIGGAALKLGRAVTSIANYIHLTGATAVSFDTDVDYLIIGGGGGGGGDNGGGGGGGGFVQGSTVVTTATAAVSVGTGGTGGGINFAGTTGGSSSFKGITAYGGGGGGGGGQSGAYLATAGASGGGGDGENNLAGAGVLPAAAGQGYAGGDAKLGGGGGGGAGGLGGDSSASNAPGNGGIGRQSAISGSWTYYGGGGGGGAENGLQAVAGTGLGGLGGGGNGGLGNLAQNGTNGLGGGGGGMAADGAGSYFGGDGGSGVVVVRYLGGSGGTGGTVASGSGTAEGYTVHSFTSTGSSTLSLSPLAATFGGTISGSGALSVNSGTGSVTLTGANTYTGATTIDGTLKIGAGGSNVASATSAIVNNGSLFINSADAVTLAANISGAGTLTKQGAGTLTLTGANSYSGSTTISAGNLVVGNGGTTGSLGTGSVFNDGTLTFNRSNDLTVANMLSGMGTLVQAGSGNLTLSGANSTSGITQLDAGTLTLGSASALGMAGSIRFGGGTLKHGTGFTNDLSARFSTAAGQQYRIDTNGQAIAYAAALTSSTGTLTKLGTGTLTLKGANSYTGATVISTGALILENDAPGALAGTISGPGTLTIRSAGASFSSALNLGGWSFGSDLGGLTIGKSGNTAGVTLGAANVAGPVSVFGGAISFGGAFSTSGTLSVAASGAVTQSGAVSAASLLLSGNGQVTLNHAGNTVGALSGGTSGARLGAVSFTNGGALNLSGSGLYSSGDVRVATVLGDLTLSQAVDTTSSSATALRLAAGTSAAAGGDGTAGAGNILVAGSPLLKVGTGGIIALFSGDVAGSTGLAALAGGAGSGRFRYNSTLASAGFTTALGANVVNAVYRQQPRIESAVNDQTITYGDSAQTVTLTNNSGLLNGDVFAGAIANAVLSTANRLAVGTYSLAPTGSLAALGYDMSGVTAGTLTVTPKALTISGITALNKIYDGTRAASLGLGSVVYDGLIAGDLVTLSASGLFADKNAGIGKQVALTSSYGGADRDNYTITDQTGAYASITPKSLTIGGISALDKIYDGARAATLDLSEVTYDGLVDGDLVTISATGLFGDKNVGNGKVVALTSGYGGADRDNYAITDQTEAFASITPKSLTISGISALDKIYDGGRSAALDLSDVFYDGLVEGDLLTVSATGLFADKNVGTGKAVALTSSYSGADRSNYTITDQTDAYASITPKLLTISGISALDKIYDGGRSAALDLSGVFYDGLVEGDLLTVSATGLFADKNVGNGKVVALTSNYSGAGRGNYTITDQTEAFASITPKSLTISGIFALDKIYDGGRSAALDLSGVFYDGLAEGDLLTISATGLFADKNVGTGKAVALASSYSGAGRGNYTITDQTDAYASITPKSLTISGIFALDKVYDGGRSATLDLSGVFYDGLVEGDLLTVSATGLFADKNVGTGKTVALTSSYEGADLQNYAITDQTDAFASITPKSLTISGISALDKIYDGGRSAALDLSSLFYDGLVEGDLLTVSATGLFADKNVGNGKVVALTSSYDGADLQNYAIIHQADAFASITPKSLTVRGISALDKVYDGGRGAALDLSGVLYEGLVEGDLLTLSATGLFDDKNVGRAKLVALTSTYAGADLGNYAITDQADAFASITPRALTISGILARDRAYDGGRTALLDLTTVLYQGLVDGDDVTVSATGLFADKNVGSAKQVALTSSYAGADIGNYLITDQTGTSATISRLDSVRWIGGASGNWFDARNWAGGAVPDLANVARVILPDGVATDFASAGAVGDVSASQPVQIEGLEGGELRMSDGILTIGTGGMSGARLTQSGGALSSTRLLDLIGLAQSGGVVSALGDLTVRESFSQGAAGSLSVGGNLAITDMAGGMELGSLSVRGATRLTSLGGDVIQSAGTMLKLGNGLAIEASNGGSSFAVVLDAAGNDLGNTITINRAARLALASTQSITLNATGLSGPATISSSAGIDGSIDSTGDIRLTSANRANIRFAGNAARLSVISDGEVVFGKAAIAGDLDVTAYGNVTEMTPGALTVNGRAVAQSTTGRVDLRAVINGEALNASVRSVTEVIISSGLDKSAAALAPIAAASGMPAPVSGLIQLPSPTVPMGSMPLASGGAVVTAMQNGVRVSFGNASGGATVAGSRTLTVTTMGGSGSLTLNIGEEAGAYVVEAGNRQPAGNFAPQTQSAVDMESLLADSLEMIVEGDSVENARFAVAIKGQTMVLVARNPSAKALAEKSANSLVGLGLAQLRQKRQLGLNEISDVVLVGENT